MESPIRRVLLEQLFVQDSVFLQTPSSRAPCGVRDVFQPVRQDPEHAVHAFLLEGWRRGGVDPSAVVFERKAVTARRRHHVLVRLQKQLGYRVGTELPCADR